MPQEENAPENEWTVMFFLAGDNSLAPSLIPQLKGLKEAGYEQKTKVIVRYDPNERGVRTGIFDLNRESKRDRRKPLTDIGDGADSFVLNMLKDEVSLKELMEARGDGAKGLVEEVRKPDLTSAADGLANFLNYCVENHSAKHYLLFLVGHGMVVGHEAFLPDDHPNTAVGLCQLRGILDKFAKDAAARGGEVELLSLHSCSMSAVEVAYELKGTARYMMASEGISFVGSLPYRQLMKKVMNVVKRANGQQLSPDAMKELISDVYDRCLFNSADFTVAGFSSDLALCDLGDQSKFDRLTEALRTLTRELRAALKTPAGADLVMLAHLKAQSYYQESYTDLYDFCRCVEAGSAGRAEFDGLKAAALGVIAELEISRDKAARFDRFVVRSEYIGPTYQYSHGLSVFFPWSPPIPDGERDALKNYAGYAFTKALRQENGPDDSWLTFLTNYFELTRRPVRRGDRDAPPPSPEDNRLTSNEKMLDDLSAAPFPIEVTFVPATVDSTALAGPDGKASPAMAKSSPADSGGGSCNCATIKNYTLELRHTVSYGARRAFEDFLENND